MMIDIEKLLTNWKNQSIQITKKENHDIDVTTMTLKHAIYHEREKTIDGYVSPQVIQLHGEGEIQTDTGPQPIPSLTYEIPALGEIDINQDRSHNQIHVKTNEATYQISLQ